MDCLRRCRVRRLRADNQPKSIRAARAKAPRMTRSAMAHLGNDESPAPFWSDPFPPEPGPAEAVAATELTLAVEWEETELWEIDATELTLATEVRL